MFRIKTLAQISEQYDLITERLEAQGRHKASRKVAEIYDCIFERILSTLGVEDIDDQALEWICEEPLIVGVSY